MNSISFKRFKCLLEPASPDPVDRHAVNGLMHPPTRPGQTTNYLLWNPGTTKRSELLGVTNERVIGYTINGFWDDPFPKLFVCNLYLNRNFNETRLLLSKDWIYLLIL